MLDEPLALSAQVAIRVEFARKHSRPFASFADHEPSFDHMGEHVVPFDICFNGFS
jgi:hypothetical protein